MLIKQLKELNKNEIATAGGKGASLGEMFNAGMPVPDGFVVTALAYKHFMDSNKLLEGIHERLAVLDVEDSRALDIIAQEIQRIIIAAEIPKHLAQEIKKEYKKMGGFVAVRSSATAEDLPEASFAGQQSTFLNIKGENEVVDAVKKCFASLFTARAIYYRNKNNFEHEKVLIAVVVQKMVEAAKAGVIFTANPVTNDRSEMIIEGAFGLGESVVGGEITPDNFIIDKKNGSVKQRTINEQTWGYFRVDGETVKKDIDYGSETVLADHELNALWQLAKKIEAHYNYPQDIEWAVGEDKKIYILQSRPITTLK
ncbi:MAG: PEP/pyruvate-binding domain-containing protein [Candidatus Woesearchaeota archaeon]|nr:PEP/pyruvate-binding domain-containing protein [Candidatus Woesearchaeota archaeon]